MSLVSSNPRQLNISLISQEDVVVIGRITLDAESSSSGSVKLNEASLCLESSRMMGSGARVPLKFDSNVKLRASVKGLGSVGLFPGAIVALKGKNGGAGWFSASEILTVRPSCFHGTLKPILNIHSYLHSSPHIRTQITQK